MSHVDFFFLFKFNWDVSYDFNVCFDTVISWKKLPGVHQCGVEHFCSSPALSACSCNAKLLIGAPMKPKCLHSVHGRG